MTFACWCSRVRQERTREHTREQGRERQVRKLTQVWDYYHMDAERPDIDDMIFGDEHPHSEK